MSRKVEERIFCVARKKIMRPIIIIAVLLLPAIAFGIFKVYQETHSFNFEEIFKLLALVLSSFALVAMVFASFRIKVARKKIIFYQLFLKAGEFDFANAKQIFFSPPTSKGSPCLFNVQMKNGEVYNINLKLFDPKQMRELVAMIRKNAPALPVVKYDENTPKPTRRGFPMKKSTRIFWFVIPIIFVAAIYFSRRA